LVDCKIKLNIEKRPMSDTAESLRRKVAMTGPSPGVYLMKDALGKVIYVGKARNLKKRLSAYFLKSSPTDVKTGVLVKNIVSFETIVTATEHEALILESNLIKRHRPRYNVILKDDKRYPLLRLDTGSPYPVLTVVRKIQRDDALYFGPFSSAGAMQQTLKLINRTFMLRKCKGVPLKPRSRPCLHYQMNQCLGPCSRDVDNSRYREIVREVILFLSGKTTDLLTKIRGEMNTASEELDFERAAVLRDKLLALRKVLERQVAVTADMKDRDILGLAIGEHLSVITVLFVRNGKLVGTRHFTFTDTLSSGAEMLETFLDQYYEKTPFVPGEILTPLDFDHLEFLEKRLSEYRKKKVRIHRPQRGEKKRMIDMAMENAGKHLEEEIYRALSEKNLLDRLTKRLHLKSCPNRIECFDNSNLQGSNPVAGMVVFENGKPKKSAYRKFKLRTVSIPDDYAAMAEVLTRRFGKFDKGEPLPNLLMLDGGKGQLNIALDVLGGIGISSQMDIVAIAKKEPLKGETRDKIFLPERSNPVNFGQDSDLLLFLQSIRDEAHRFAISFYRKSHRSAAIRSELDAIPGIGKKRKQTLFKRYKSIHNIRSADPSEIAALPGFNRRTADAVSQGLKKG
jgi:excinuclease ABC subunit C